MVKVAQCWDDGVFTDIRLAEICRRHNAKATFNLCPGTMGERSVPAYWAMGKISGTGFRSGKVGKRDLLEVYGDFQVASHCMRHENAQQVPLKEFVSAAVDARKFLEDLFQRSCPGFAWPYGATTPDSIQALREAGFIYGRTTLNTGDMSVNPDPVALSSNCHFMSRDFWNLFDQAKAGCGIFYFWGHSYEMFDCGGLWNQYEQRLALLEQDPEVEWIDVRDIPALLKK